MPPSSSAALVPFNKEKYLKAIRGLWSRRVEQKQDSVPSEERIVQSHVDDVFLVLALFGEALLPLGVLDETHYHKSPSEVETAISRCGHATVRNVFEKMTDELKYLMVASFTSCALFAPMHVYRGFGACVVNDWDWGCPDTEYLQRKVKKETSMFHEETRSSTKPASPLGFRSSYTGAAIQAHGFPGSAIFNLWLC